MARHHSVEIRNDGIAVLTLDMAEKSTNILSMEMVEELERAFQRISSMKKVSGLMVRSAKPKQFIAGADVDEIFALNDASEAAEASRLGQDLMNDIENLPFPSIAVIDGACLGGGLELALACTYRIAGEEAHVKLSLPECRLGIIPGFGGTQRLPKIVGLICAMDMILSSKTLTPKKAKKYGLVEDVVPSAILEDVAISILKEKPSKNRSRHVSHLHSWMEKIPKARALAFKKAHDRTVVKTQGFYPAPLAALEVLEQTFEIEGAEGYEIESRKVGELIASPVAKSLIYLFRATEEIRKEIPKADAKAIQKVGVIGAGVMGSGIAQLVSRNGSTVRLKDVSTKALSSGMNRISNLDQKEFKRGRISKRELDRRWQRVSPTTEWTGFAQADLIIEAALENLEIKQEIFRELDQHVRPETVLATNTSALSVSQIASTVAQPQRVVGLHFFNPVHRMPLIEVIRGEETSEQTLSTALQVAISLGKTPIVVKDRPGFFVNRVLGIYLKEAACAAEDGIPISEIESAMKSFGMPMGPFELMDEVGLDIAEEVGTHLSESFPHFPSTSNLITAIRTDGRVGKKSGKGFYAFNGKKKPVLDQEYIDNTLKTLSKRREFSFESNQYTFLVDRFVLLMLNEALRCLEEDVVQNERDIDVGMVLGTGFAPFRGGLMAYARNRGLKEICETLEKLSTQLGDHFKPCEYLKALAEEA